MEAEKGLTAGERFALAVVAMIPAAVENAGVMARSAGRLVWMAPLLALPVAPVLRRVWNEFSPQGRWIKGLYLLWALWLLILQGASHTVCPVEEWNGVGRWLPVGVGVTVCLWAAGRRAVEVGRAAKIHLGIVAVTTVGVLLALLPKAVLRDGMAEVREEGQGLLRATAQVIGLWGYGVCVTFLPRASRERLKRRWVVIGMGCYATVLWGTVTVLGPRLMSDLRWPILTVLGRGKVLVSTVLTLCRWAGVALVSQVVARLWQEFFGTRRGACVAITAAFLGGAVCFGEDPQGTMGEILTAWGGLFMGAALPMFELLRGRIREMRK